MPRTDYRYPVQVLLSEEQKRQVARLSAYLEQPEGTLLRRAWIAWVHQLEVQGFLAEAPEVPFGSRTEQLREEFKPLSVLPQVWQSVEAAVQAERRHEFALAQGMWIEAASDFDDLQRKDKISEVSYQLDTDWRQWRAALIREHNRCYEARLRQEKRQRARKRS